MRIRSEPPPKPRDEPKGKPKLDSGKEEKGDKEFKLPKKDVEQAQVQMEFAARQQAQQVSGEVKTAEVEAGGTRAAAIQAIVSVRDVILKMVDSMQVGVAAGQSLLYAQLKDDASIHQALRGATLRLEMTQEGLNVQIEPVPGQKDMAEALIGQHQKEVAQLQEALAAKNIHLQQLEVGDLVIELPGEKLLTPNELFSGQQQAGSGWEGGKEGRPPERINPIGKD